MNSKPSSKGQHRSGLSVFLVVSAVVLASRIPFIFAGYGVDPDAWRLINAAMAIDETGRYAASRLPGYPIPEYAYSVLYHFGPVVVNGLVALLSAVAAGFFALTLKASGSRRYLMGSLAFAFTPIVFINSTCSMDYVWGLSFSMASLYAAFSGRSLLSGILLGIAIGCRLTSIAMILPLLLVLYYRVDKHYLIRGVVAFVAAAMFIGASAFLPVISANGPRFMCFCDNIEVPLNLVMQRASIDLWGGAGFVTLIVVLGIRAIKGRRSSQQELPKHTSISAAGALVIAIYFLAFLRLPHEAAYLIPAVPFALVLLDRALSTRSFAAVCILISLSSFVDISHEGISPGAVVRQHMSRVNGLEYVDRVIKKAKSLPAGTAVVAGPWQPQISARINENKRRNAIKYLYVLTTRDVRRLNTQGLSYYFLPTEENASRTLDVRPFQQNRPAN